MKKHIYLIAVLFIFILIFFYYVIFKQTKGEIIKNKAEAGLAIMVQNASGTYEKYDKETWPTTGYQFNPIKSECKNGTKLKWDGNSIIMNTMKSDNCNVYFDKAIKVWNFEFNNSEYMFEVETSGLYKIELWGASGGNASGFRENYGGLGAYVSGVINLNAGIKLYITVGGRGIDQLKNSTNAQERILKGGYNGGGGANGYGMCWGASGGGASHIALISGLLYTLETNKENILMVAGAGGGASKDTDRSDFEGHGGAAGIFNGYDGNTSGNTQCSAKGATLTEGGISTCDANGSFGRNTTSRDGGAGGSGLYAGASADCSGGGGGTSYISGIEGFPDFSSEYKFISSFTSDGVSTMPTHDGNDLMIGNSGNGYARITLISQVN